MKRSKKKLATQAAIAIAMKKAGKKPKKFQEGGGLDASQAQAYVNMLLNQAGTGEEKEDLMEGRHYIPRMSSESREKLIELGGDAIKKARMKSLERRIARKDEIIDEAEGKKANDPEEVRDPDQPVQESSVMSESPVEGKEVAGESATGSLSFNKYGGKILKKYKKRKKR
jgi:hypothetical protein